MNGRSIAQTAQKKAQAAAQSARQGAIDETQHLLRTAAGQVTGTDRAPRPEQAPGFGQSTPNIPDPNQHASTEALWAEEKRKNDERMAQLRAIIKKEEEEARAKRQQTEKAWQETQVQALQADAAKKQEEEKKGGILATLGRAAKRIKGRLGHVGKSKMEKGRAASG